MRRRGADAHGGVPGCPEAGRVTAFCLPARRRAASRRCAPLFQSAFETRSVFKRQKEDAGPGHCPDAHGGVPGCPQAGRVIGFLSAIHLFKKPHLWAGTLSCSIDGFFYILQTFPAGRSICIAKEYQPPCGIRRKIWQILHLT